MTQTEERENWTPVTVAGVRERVAAAREDHRARMDSATDAVLAAVRPRWVIVLGWTAATQRRADHWQVAANVAFAALLLLVTGLLAKAVLGKTVLMVATSYAATGGVLKLIRIQLTRPFTGDGEDGL